MPLGRALGNLGWDLNPRPSVPQGLLIHLCARQLQIERGVPSRNVSTVIPVLDFGGFERITTALGIDVIYAGIYMVSNHG
jgi:hypothetical protein